MSSGGPVLSEEEVKILLEAFQSRLEVSDVQGAARGDAESQTIIGRMALEGPI